MMNLWDYFILIKLLFNYVSYVQISDTFSFMKSFVIKAWTTFYFLNFFLQFLYRFPPMWAPVSVLDNTLSGEFMNTSFCSFRCTPVRWKMLNITRCHIEHFNGPANRLLWICVNPHTSHCPVSLKQLMLYN